MTADAKLLALPVRQLKQYDNLVIEDANGHILGADEIVAALNTLPPYVQGGASKPLAEVLSIKLGDRAGSELPITLSRREWDLIVAALNAPTVPDRESVELAKQMWLTLDGNRGYNLTITAARTKRIAEEFLKLTAPDWLSRISGVR